MAEKNITGTAVDIKNVAILIQALERFEEINNNGYQFEYVGYSASTRSLIVLATNGFCWTIGVHLRYEENSKNPFTWAWGHYKDSKEDAIKEFDELCPLQFYYHEDERNYTTFGRFIVWRSNHSIEEVNA